MDKSSCNPSHVGQAGQRGNGRSGAPGSDDDKPTGQAGTGQSDDPAKDPAAPEDYDSDPQGGGGRLDQVDAGDVPVGGGDAPSHGSR